MRILILPMVLLATLGPAQQDRLHDPSDLTGRWSGTGVFFDRALHERTGPVPITLSIDGNQNGNRTGSGRIGGAAIRITQLRARGDHLEIIGRLAGDIGYRELGSKDHVVFVVTTVSDSSARAEFHLKSNGVFDPRMREGSVTLVRR